jgi:hypothetical protein
MPKSAFFAHIHIIFLYNFKVSAWLFHLTVRKIAFNVVKYQLKNFCAV